MRKIAIPLVLLLLCPLAILRAAISISTTSLSTQNFDSIGTTATATLPVDFKVDRTATATAVDFRKVGTFAAASNATTQTGGVNLITNASNGIYNFGSSTGDRAIGFLSSGSGTASGNLYAQLKNNTGAALDGLQISYDVEKYRNGTNTAGYRIQMFYSTDGATWTNAGGDFLTSFAADANNLGFATAPGQTVNVANKTLSVNIPNGSDFYLAWNFSTNTGATATNSQALAVDNISILGLASADQAPSVSGTVPAAGAPNAAVTSAVTVNFNESVTPAANAFSLICGGTPQSFTQAPPAGTAASSFTLTPATNLPYSSNCVIGVASGLVSDADANDPPDHMTADFSASFSTEPAADEAPSVASTTPVAGATNVPVDSNIAINFTEAVNAPAGAFSISCGGPPVAFGLLGSGTAAVTLDPNVDLPYSKLCTVTLTASQITDTDGNDPPDAMLSAAPFSFTTEDPPPPVATNVMINELDSDTPGADAAEFVELYDGGIGNTALDGLTVVFYNGSNDLSYAAFDLDGKKTDANGYFLLGNVAVPGVGLAFNGNLLQNGPDAVALYAANATSFPNNTPLTLNKLQDAVVYDTADADDPELLTLLTGGGQVDESSGGTGDTKSIGRCENGSGGLRDTSTFKTGAPSPGGVNNCPPPPLPFTTDPPANGINVPRDPTIVVSFNEPVTVLANPFELTCASGQHNEHTMSAVGRFIDITPNVPLTPGEMCTMTIFGDSVSDADGIGADPLPANYSWTFKVADGIAPPYGPEVHLTFGNPTNAEVADPQDPDNYLMLKPAYSLSYNASLGRPNWVSWHLTTEWFGSLVRVDTFRADPMVPPDWYRVQGFDFSGSGFDRGHMVPNADRDHQDRIPVNQATYLMTNMIAQAPDNNQGPWAAMENDLRTIAGEGNELYIVSGPQGFGGTGSAGGVTTTIANGHVAVPAYTWKVALVLPLGNNDLSRVSCSTRTIAVILPNVQGIRNNDWHQYLTTVDAVEDLTGYNFFSSLPQNVQYCIEAGTNGNNLPADFDPPVVTCGAADGQWHTGNVTLSCTVTDSGSGLANAADGSFTLSTSVGAGAEDGNASTHSRQVCDKAGNCATAVVTGNRIDRKTPSVSCGPADAAWHPGNVSIACASSDDGSGVSAPDAAFSLMTSVGAGVEDANASTGSVAVCDLAGNCTTAGPVAGNKVDRKAPSVACGAADGTWHGDNVSIACSSTEGGAGLVNATDASFVLATTVADDSENANASTGSRTVCDAVGNCTTAGPIAGNKIDRKDPSITLTMPVDGATYALNTAVTASFSCADTGSGVAACVGGAPNGAAVDTASTGPKSFVVTVTDVVGNTASRSVSYTVTNGPAHKRTPGLSITNIPSAAANGGSFTPVYSYDGDGNIHLKSLTPSACRVQADSVVNFVSAGTCTLVPWATASGSVNPAQGAPQSFAVAP